MTRPVRKPLRRTAWALFLGGLVLTAVMLGTGILVVAQGKLIGPGRTVVWPADTEIAVMRALGPQQDLEHTGPTCTVTAPGERPMPLHPVWGRRVQPILPQQTTLTCDEPARVLSGSSITVANVVRGPLIAVPAFAAGVGVFLFFPRFTALVARLSHPFGRVVDRVTGRDGR